MRNTAKFKLYFISAWMKHTDNWCALGCWIMPLIILIRIDGRDKEEESGQGQVPAQRSKSKYFRYTMYYAHPPTHCPKVGSFPTHVSKSAGEHKKKLGASPENVILCMDWENEARRRPQDRESASSRQRTQFNPL